MKRYAIMTLPALVLSACTTISNETRTEAFIDRGLYEGERYEIRQRLVEGPTGTFEQTSVVYKGFSRTCILDSPNDCSTTAEALVEYYDTVVF